MIDRLRARLDRLAQRWPALGVVLAVQKRFGELHGNNLAASVTLQAFLSLFPLLLVAIAVVGFFTAGRPDFPGRVIAELGLTGDAAKAVTDAMAVAEESRRTATAIGVVGLLWSGLGLVNALQYGYDQVWQVKDRGMKDKAYGLLWLVGAGVLMAAGTGFTALVGLLPGVMAPLALAGALVVNFALFMWTAHTLPNIAVGWRALAPGAVLGAIGLEALKAIGAFLVPRMVAQSSALYGSLGTVFAMLAWLLVFSRLLLYASVLNVVLYERGHGTVRARVDVPRLPQSDDGEAADRTGRVAVSRD